MNNDDWLSALVWAVQVTSQTQENQVHSRMLISKLVLRYIVSTKMLSYIGAIKMTNVSCPIDC